MSPQETRGRVYLGNAFSLQMLPITEKPITIEVRKIGEEVKKLLSGGFISVIGHQTTASALSRILGIEVPTNRVSIQLQPGDLLIIFQLTLGRLPVGQELSEQDIIKAYNEGKAFFIAVRIL